ncbi:unnamed protein product [Ceratitis capitata]|uniref:(Mediterranean fruit fly) hypothetical protein n=1 Tax=Ceratitis capitata TaxID=7213 RepID=A0A811UMH6_CERCA|nr:unnamed protein product [Ceratitis capitata]
MSECMMRLEKFQFQISQRQKRPSANGYGQPVQVVSSTTNSKCNRTYKEHTTSFDVA